MGPLFEPSVPAIALASAVAALAVPLELRDGNIPSWLALGGLSLATVLALLRSRLLLHAGGFALTAFPGMLLWRQGSIGGGAYELVSAVGTLGGRRARRGRRALARLGGTVATTGAESGVS